MLYAACADGTTGLPEESWLQLMLVVAAAATCGAWLYRGGLNFNASPAGWIGVVLLAAFAAWTGITMLWSVAPDRTWIELNRGIAYALVAVLGIALGSSLPRAPERVMKALAIVVAPIALYAIGGKTIPGVSIGGIIDFGHAGGVTRLRAPLEYWNALALMCVFGLPPMLRLAADPVRRDRARIVALLGVHVLVLVIGLTYSRGGVLALLAALATFLAFAPQRVRSLVLFLGAAFMASVPMTLALVSPDLTTNALPVERRVDDARLVLFALIASSAIVAGFGALVMRLERGRMFTPARGRRIGRPLAIGFAGLIALGFVNAAATGALGDAADSFTGSGTREGEGLTDPTRLLSTNSGNRWTWWQEAAGAWSDRPVGGWGAGSFPVTHKRYREVPLPVQQPHSVPLQFMAETGLVGAVLGLGALLALLVAALARVRSLPWRMEGDAAARGAAAALVAAPVAWAVHCFYDWDWDIPGVTVPMLLVAGVLAARPARRALEAEAPGLRGLGFAGVIAALALVALSALLPLLADNRTSAALAAIGEEKVTEAQLAQAASDAELAATLNPVAVQPLYAAAAIAERRGNLEEARRQLLRALDRQPHDVEGWFELTRLDFARLDRAGVRSASLRALQLDPLNRAAFALASRAEAAAVLPGESATATGSPLPTQVPITEPAPVIPGAVPSPAPSPTPFPSPIATPPPIQTPFPGASPITP